MRTGLDLIEEVEVRPADSRGEDLYDDIFGSRLRLRDLDELHDSSRLEPNRPRDPGYSRRRNEVCDRSRWRPPEASSTLLNRRGVRQALDFEVY